MKSFPLITRTTVALIVLAAVAMSAQIQQAWVAKYNNNGITNGNHQALKMALDSTGNIYVLGISANVNTNTGYVVVKYGPSGNQVWAARYDSTNFPAATPTGFALDSSNAIVVTGNAVTLKYDANGDLLWAEPYTGSGIAVDPDQNLYITGVSSKFSTLKLNPAGSNIWTATWAYDGLANASQAIVIDSSNNVYAAGLGTTSLPGSPYQYVFLVKYDKNGNQLWVSTISQAPRDNPKVVGLVVGGGGGIYIEFNYPPGTGIPDGFQSAQVNIDGTTAWYNANPTGSLGSQGYGIALDKQDNLLVTGGFAYAYPFEYTYATFKLNTNGSCSWTNFYPTVSSGNGTATSVASDDASSAYVTGYSTNAVAGNDIITIKYDSHGNQIWIQRYDGSGRGDDAGNAIKVDNAGNVYVAGYETETNGFTSMILIKYSPVALQKQTNGSVILHAYGSPGETFDIQASTNLQTWQDLGDIIADTNGVVSYDDTNASLFPSRFYYTIPQ